MLVSGDLSIGIVVFGDDVVNHRWMREKRIFVVSPCNAWGF